MNRRNRLALPTWRRPAAGSCRLVLTVLAAWSAAALAAHPCPAGAQDAAPQRMFEREPYDELTLRDNGQERVFAIVPLDLQPRRLPEKRQPTDRIRVRLLDDPQQKEYEIRWRDIVRIRLFEEMIEAEARTLLEQGRFDEAFPYYEHLHRHYPRWPGLHAAIGYYRFREAEALLQQQKFEEALLILNELWLHDAEYPGLQASLSAATAALVSRRLEQKQYEAARALVDRLRRKFPRDPLVQLVGEQLQQEARSVLATAQQAWEQGRLFEAREAAMAAARIWPLDESRRLLEEAQRIAPRVVVAVSTRAAVPDAARLDDWAARRTGALVQATWTRFVGTGPEGGQYRPSLGEISVAPSKQSLLLHLPPQAAEGLCSWSAADVAQQFLQRADPRGGQRDAVLGELLSGVTVEDVYRVRLDFRRRLVHPLACLQHVPVRAAPNRESPPEGDTWWGPYQFLPRDESVVHLRAVGEGFPLREEQPREIVERHYADLREAELALLRGEVAVLDRVPPWRLAQLRASRQVHVEPYSVPTLHCLIPAADHPLLARPAMRRALLLGIDRTMILQQLFQGDPPPGNVVVSGPFPLGSSVNDPLGYAYNRAVQPHPYDPRLAMALAAVARREVQAASGAVEPAGTAARPLVLAYPASEVAEIACRSIKKHLEPLGMAVELQRMAPGVDVASYPCDLRFAELSISEPLVDALRLLGPRGVAASNSPYLQLALRQLTASDDWRSSTLRLHEVHRLVHEELPLLPLWQLIEHYARHPQMQGIASRPATLYQDVERWQTPPGLLGPADGAASTTGETPP
jgi:tetratricopeptide (TPR) repeat protein